MRETRKKNFTVRLSETEYQRLCEMAERASLSAGAYIRKILFSEKGECEKV